MTDGREKASSRAARIWAAKPSCPGADCRRDGSGPFWNCTAEEKAYTAGYIAGKAQAQVECEADYNAGFAAGYTEAAARLGKGPPSSSEET